MGAMSPVQIGSKAGQAVAVAARRSGPDLKVRKPLARAAPSHSPESYASGASGGSSEGRLNREIARGPSLDQYMQVQPSPGRAVGDPFVLVRQRRPGDVSHRRGIRADPRNFDL